MNFRKLITVLLVVTFLFGTNSCSKDEDDTPPSKILITKIRVTKFPATDSGGAGWDLLSGADIFPKVLKGSTVLWDSPTYTEDASASSSHDFTPSPSIQISDLSSQHTIELYDYDNTDPDDWMGGINFTPSSFINGAPSSFTLDAGGSTAFEVFVDYVY